MVRRDLASSGQSSDTTAVLAGQEAREQPRGKLRLVHDSAARERDSLGREAAGWEHSLDGQPVEPGELLCVTLADGRSLVGRYRWSGLWADNPELEMLLKDHTVARLVLPPNAHVERVDQRML
jgi:hypothetical protein